MKKKKPYYVSFSINSRLGKAKGRKEFDSFYDAQSFAIRVSNQKSAQLVSWGTNRSKR